MKKVMALSLAVLMMLALPLSAFAVPSEETDPNTIEISISMELLDDNTVFATLYDNRGGAVARWPVSLEINGEVVERQETDSRGDVAFNYQVTAADTQIACIADDGGYDVYTFVGCKTYLNDTMVVEPEGDATTEPPSGETDTETTAPTLNENDVPLSTTDSFSFAPMTTTVNNTLVGVGVDVDNGIVNAMQTTAASLTSRSRMWMEQAQYDALASSADAMLHLQLTLNTQAAPKSVLIAAKNADPDYAKYEDAQVKGFAMDLTLMYIEGDSRVPLEPAEEGMYTVEIPVPEVLSRSETFAVAVCTVNGVDTFLELKPENGMLKFTVKRFQTLALVGFGDTGAVGTVAQTPWLLVILGGVGLLLVVGGVLLLVFITFRRRKKTSAVKVDENDVKDSTRKIMIEPTAEVEIESELGVPTEVVDKPVLIHYDEQSALDDTEREHFRAKSTFDATGFDRITTQAVTPADQISATQLQKIKKERDALQNASLNDMLDAMIEEIDSDRI